ncbi:hypothetical protein ACVW0J_005032 [Bradyrhizobium sp. i1.7.7]
MFRNKRAGCHRIAEDLLAALCRSGDSSIAVAGTCRRVAGIVSLLAATLGGAMAAASYATFDVEGGIVRTLCIPFGKAAQALPCQRRRRRLLPGSGWAKNAFTNCVASCSVSTLARALDEPASGPAACRICTGELALAVDAVEAKHARAAKASTFNSRVSAGPLTRLFSPALRRQAIPRKGRANCMSRRRVAFAAMKSCSADEISMSVSAARWASASATSDVASRDHPSMGLKDTIRTG